MNYIVQRYRRRPSKPPSKFPVWLGIIVILALGAGGYWAIDRFAPEQTNRATTSKPPVVKAPHQQEMTARFTMCGRDRYTCVVDGDTVWLRGTNLRLQSYDTPEPHDNICGGQKEVTLAKKASARLLALLNENPFTVETFGLDNTGTRTLATISIKGRDVGDILISERLARKWPDGDEWWCR